MAHGPATDWGKDNAAAYKAKLGIFLFAFYGVFYAGFIIINTLFPKVMGILLLFEVNLAIYYGSGLIILAFVMGIIYNFLCSKKEKELNKDDQKGGQS